MSLPSKSELIRLFDEDSLATEAWIAEGVLSWPSLRILERLAKEDAASTGELARALNMDMREVRDHLEALEESDVVTRDGDAWRLTVSDINFNITYQNDQLVLSHSVNPAGKGSSKRETTVADRNRPTNTPNSDRSDAEVSNKRLFERIGYKLDQLLF